VREYVDFYLAIEADDGHYVSRVLRAPTAGELQTLFNQIIRRLMRLLTRQGYLVEEQGMT
jgi:hypothetical protein